LKDIPVGDNIKMDVSEIEGKALAVTEFVKQCLAVLAKEYHFEFYSRREMPMVISSCKRKRQSEVMKGKYAH
jgi:hypothetical protein